MSTTTVEFKSLLPYLHKVIDSHDLTGLRMTLVNREWLHSFRRAVGDR